jgi:hypothetical protein
MILRTQLSYIILAVTLFTACNSREKEEQLAEKRLQIIHSLIQNNELNAAKIQIDSLHVLFPRLINKRKVAAIFKDTIVVRESKRTLKYCDSMLVVLQQEYDSIRQNFRFEKNTTYQEIGNYVYKNYSTENHTDRTYLKCYVDENADIFLLSNYYGSPIQHVSVRVSCGDLFAQTDSIHISNAANHSYTIDGVHRQTIRFKTEQNGNLIHFIAEHAEHPIKVSLLGKSTISYMLTPNDKKAMKESFIFWMVKSDIVQLEKEIKKAKQKIEKIASTP